MNLSLQIHLVMISRKRVVAVVASGWRAGDLILEKARLNWIDQLPVESEDQVNDAKHENGDVVGEILHP